MENINTISAPFYKKSSGLSFLAFAFYLIFSYLALVLLFVPYAYFGVLFFIPISLLFSLGAIKEKTIKGLFYYLLAMLVIALVLWFVFIFWPNYSHEQRSLGEMYKGEFQGFVRMLTHGI